MVLALPFVRLFEKLSIKLIKDKDEEKMKKSLKYIDKHLLNTPSIAMMQVKKEIINMMDLSYNNIQLGFKRIIEQDNTNDKVIIETEDKIDYINNKITDFMIDLTHTVSISEEKTLGSYFHVVNDIERIGDHAFNFYESSLKMVDNDLSFSEIAKKEFNDMFDVSLLNMIDLKANLTILIIALASIYTIGVLCSWTWTRTMAIVTQKYLNLFRIDMFGHMQKLPIKYFDTHQNGQIMSLYTNDIDTIRQFISSALPNLFSTGLTIIGCLFVMLSLSIWMSLVVLLGTVAMMLNTKFIGGRASRYYVAQQKSLGKVEGNIEESITGLKVIKVFTHEEESLQTFEQVNDELCKNSTIANIHGNIMGPINGNIGNFVYVFVAILGCILYITPGTFNVSITGIQEVNAAVFYSKLLVPIC